MTRFGSIVITLCGLLACGCHVQALHPAEPGGSSAKATSAEWTECKDPRGFAVRYPQGWNVEVSGDARIVIHSADKTVFAIVQPFLARQGGSAQEWVEKSLYQMNMLLPQASIKQTKQLHTQPDEVLASVNYGLGNAEGQANVLCSLYEGSGMFYAIAAPSSQFAAKKPTLLKILRSFQFTQPSVDGPKKNGADAGIEYVTWRDPKEGAFTLQVPRGWKVDGGLFRFAAIDVRKQIVVTSPDGQIKAQIGDSSLPGYSVPTPLGERMGFTEGKPYDIGAGVRLIIARYRTGAQFSQMYVQKRMAQTISGLQIGQARDLPDLSRAINAIYEQNGLGGMIHVDLGEVSFTGTQNGRAVRGSCGTMTQLTQGGGTGIWGALPMFSVATEEKAALADAVLSRMIGTLKDDPQWSAQQSDTALRVSQIMTEANNKIMDMRMESFHRQQHAQDESARKWSNTILGLTDVKDDEGNTWKVSSGHNYYWHKGNTIVGTNTYRRPDIDFEPLQEW